MISKKWITLAVLILIPSLLSAADPLFEPRADYPTGGGHLFRIVAADVDADGDIDLAIVYFGGAFSILKNNGDGAFLPPVSYSPGALATSIFSADLDGDGDMDVAISNGQIYSGSVSILKNNGDGSFRAPVKYSLEPDGDFPMSVNGADFDGDGDVDLATANRNTDNISVLKNNGDGSFQPPVNYSGGGGPHYAIVSSDLDGDLDTDLVAATHGGWALVWKNQGDGTFLSGGGFLTDDGSNSVFARDLNGDGYMDLATTNDNSADVSILINNGDGTFQSAINYPTGENPWSVYGADLDVDGDNDLAVANQGDSVISIFMNNGDGSFQTSVNFAVGKRPSSVVAADLDLDGDPDLAVTNESSATVSILINNSIIVCTSKPGDANGSGVPDLTDVIYLVNYIFKGGTAPYPLCRGDANGSGDYPNLTDLIYLVNYVFKSGPVPVPGGRCCL